MSKSKLHSNDQRISQNQSYIQMIKGLDVFY